MPTNQNLNERAKAVLPGGVNSPVRAFKAVGGNPPYIASAKGATMTDVEGKQYIDYMGSWGPMILGHTHPEVTAALRDALDHGTSYGASCAAEVELAEEIVNRVPGLEMVRFVNSGTEATMSALRLARAATKREVIIKFAGGYHGHADSFLIQAGSGVATFGAPDSPGVTEGAAKDTRVARFNDLHSVRSLFEAEPDAIAAVIVEPVPGNMGVILANEGFLEGLRELCDEFGALLIFDEVMTGFRIARGGAVERFGITPDLATYGKVIGGGLPVGAYGGRRELMEKVSPSGPVYQAGTLSGNPLAMTAGLATLRLLDDDAYSTLEMVGEKLQVGLDAALKSTGVPGVIQRVGSMITLFFNDTAISCFEDVQAADHQRYAVFFRGMLERGIYLPPSGYEAWFLSTAHRDEQIKSTVVAAEEVFRSFQAGLKH